MDSHKSSSPSVKSIIDLYTKIPEYSALKQLGNSEFIYKIEKLKEEFREIRSSLYKEDDELESVGESSLKELRISQQASNRCGATLGRSVAGSSKLKVTNQIRKDERMPFLAVSRCEMHQNPPISSGYVQKYHRRPSTGLSMSLSSLSLSYSNLYENTLTRRSVDRDVPPRNEISAPSTSLSSASLSHWSSSPELSTFRRKEYFPPQNIENRLLHRKAQNKSNYEMSRNKNVDSTSVSNLQPRPFRVSRIPSAISKPLFDQIMEQNNKRSRKVREQSKQKLMAQVKPFSFTKSTERFAGFRPSEFPADFSLALNNSKIHGRDAKNPSLKYGKNLRVHKNTLQASPTFKANPAPPRSRALMSALRLKEQQEYRELKKQLRSEALMKLSSLPPGMASRNRRYKIPNIQTPGEKYGQAERKQWKRHQNLDNEYSSCTDEDRVSEVSDAENASEPEPGNNHGSTEKRKYKKSPNGSYASGLSRILKESKSAGVFESTSNDNIASRLRVEAAKRKEADRSRREAEENAKLRKSDEKRYKLRNFHSDVWRRACSYSSNQDIAIRRQLRMAAAILENDSFRREMSTMLSRVQSAPLLLEGVRERHCEPCKKHQQEMQISARSAKLKMNIPKSPTTPRKYLSRRNWTSAGEDEFLYGGVTGDGHSETLAIAEGSLTNSDNESVKGNQLEEDQNVTQKEGEDDAAGIDEATKIEQEADAIIGEEN